jgi:hypothetical protein
MRFSYYTPLMSFAATGLPGGSSHFSDDRCAATWLRQPRHAVGWSKTCM